MADDHHEQVNMEDNEDDLHQNPTDSELVEEDEEEVVEHTENEWVTFEDGSSEFGDFEYAPLATEANYETLEEVDDAPQETLQEGEDNTTSGFLRKKFTQEHIDLIKECMKNVKLAYVPEWAKITNEEPRWISALKRSTDTNDTPQDIPEK